MIGGTVIEVCNVPGRPGVLYVDCADRRSKSVKRLDFCAVLVEENATSQKIEIGDYVWWQSCRVYWTPIANRGEPLNNMKTGREFDIVLAKVGHSGIKHPLREV